MRHRLGRMANVGWRSLVTCRRHKTDSFDLNDTSHRRTSTRFPRTRFFRTGKRQESERWYNGSGDDNGGGGGAVEDHHHHHERRPFALILRLLFGK